MDWISKYRLSPFGFTTDHNDEEIFQFILNHDIYYHSIIERRNILIDQILNDIKDPLEWLNPYLDILYGNITMTMSLPVMNVYNHTNYVVDYKSIDTKHYTFDNIGSMKEWIVKIKKDSRELFVYLLELKEDTIILRCHISNRIENLIKVKKKR